jgi:hypothetical protein
MALADFLPKCGRKLKYGKKEVMGPLRTDGVSELMEIDAQSWGVAIATCLPYPQQQQWMARFRD